MAHLYTDHWVHVESSQLPGLYHSYADLEEQGVYTVRYILSTSRTSILGFNSTNGEDFMPSPFSSGVPRDTIGKRNPSLLVWDDERLKMCGKALGVSW